MDQELIKSLEQSLSKIGTTETEVVVASSGKNLKKVEANDRERVSAIINKMMMLSKISRKVSPERASLLAQELVALNIPDDKIEQGFKRYAMSFASQFREIQLSDFTNETISSEYELLLKTKEIEKREEELKNRIIKFNEEVKKQVNKELENIEVDLNNLCKKFDNQKVILSRAVDVAFRILVQKQNEKIKKQSETQLKILEDLFEERLKQINNT
jgi:hypothetical protein